MTVQFRNYTAQPGFTDDFHAVRKFLVRINRTNPIRYDFEWGRWEWAFSLTFLLDTENLGRIGVWEDNGQIVALATYEERPGAIYFCIDPGYDHLKAEMLAYSMAHLRGEDGSLKVLVNNADQELGVLAATNGFLPTQETEPNSVYDIDLAAIAYELPPGYRLQSLAEEDAGGVDIKQFNRCLWRGFNHEGDPPESEGDLADRWQSISGPHLDRELCIVAVVPNGDYAAYCGMWYDERTDYCLVEPVATDPDHRKLGLGKAVVLEGIRRCALRGATQAYVGSGQQFYYQIGFRPLPTSTFWTKGR